jgi:membrane protease YdiL (CAAX protease family)
MATLFDHLLVTLLVIGAPFWAHRNYARLERAVAAGQAGARHAAYSTAVIVQWLVTLAVMVSWIARDGDWTTLGFAPRVDVWPLLLALALSAFLLLQCIAIALHAEAREAVRAQVRDFAALLPHDRPELTGFLALSITAGICEEIVFRGYIPAYFGQWMSPWMAQAVTLAAFGVAHAYLGRKAALRATAAGLVAAVLFLWSGSLLPGMIFHAAADVSAGIAAYLAFRPDSDASEREPTRPDPS